jgi:hypothetical protein
VLEVGFRDAQGPLALTTRGLSLKQVDTAPPLQRCPDPSWSAMSRAHGLARGHSRQRTRIGAFSPGCIDAVVAQMIPTMVGEAPTKV